MLVDEDVIELAIVNSGQKSGQADKNGPLSNQSFFHE
jgi:hypothetical protein